MDMDSFEHVECRVQSVIDWTYAVYIQYICLHIWAWPHIFSGRARGILSPNILSPSECHLSLGCTRLGSQFGRWMFALAIPTACQRLAAYFQMLVVQPFLWLCVLAFQQVTLVTCYTAEYLSVCDISCCHAYICPSPTAASFSALKTGWMRWLWLQWAYRLVVLPDLVATKGWLSF